ncbi:DUF4876 domain-containing protein [Odoribacteraceae bacterium]|nr:DUF4876 domain-containing protein [Butyricimonas paravirosa]BDF53143.1 DUF4876 domain-containing protein [Odoribacteraceae bacterium]GKH92082.1 DUF4876 domain-containing protein [Odoribacteraceae bacterium]GKH96700.1 DUF4876 domain-containing protein [Odoribacteraceae bacterium]GKI03579.1 DUF4876 domain-containing protein [Odoribacteraceae bacterium]
MKNILSINIIGLFILLLGHSSCTDQFNKAGEAKKMTPLTISVQPRMTETDDQTPIPNELTVKLENFSEGISIEKEISYEPGKTLVVDSVIPGIYSITISGKAQDDNNDEYFFKGNKVNEPLVASSTIEIDISGLVAGKMKIIQMYYCGSKTLNNTNYFRDQFYEFYNNTESETFYMDDIYIAYLYPTTASSTNSTVWPSEDGDQYVYAQQIWKFPGNGTDYPLKAGESCVVAQFAANHRLATYNPNSPVDCSSAEFEFNCNNANFPDQPAYDMEIVFYNGKKLYTMPQVLWSVFGPAIAIFKIPEGESYDPVNDLTMQTTDLGSTNRTLHAKVPRKWLLDVVETGANINSITGKRVPAVLDAGLAYVGDTYVSLGIHRKVESTRDNGDPIFMDTNNSTDDFDMGVTPVFRKYNTKMPSWNHTLK